VIAVVKHFPGLGRAQRTTDEFVVTIHASAADLQADLLPFRTAVDAGVPMVMLSNAVYPVYGPQPAGWEPAIAGSLLRDDLGFRGVSITDSLDGAALARGTTPLPYALQALDAGTDIILITGSEATSAAVFAELRREARAGSFPHAQLLASYRRILRLKSELP
jgi:beta-N-acetylhexosaminidase